MATGAGEAEATGDGEAEATGDGEGAAGDEAIAGEASAWGVAGAAAATASRCG